MAKQYANKLSDVLSAIDYNDKNFFKNLTEPQKKELAGNMWVTMRYCSAVEKQPHDANYLIFTNLLVNVDFSKLYDHPNLIWRLMAMCGSGSKQYHYLPPVSKPAKRDKRQEILVKIFPEYNADEIELLLKINDRETIIDWCRDNGYDEASELF